MHINIAVGNTPAKMHVCGENCDVHMWMGICSFVFGEVPMKENSGIWG